MKIIYSLLALAALVSSERGGTRSSRRELKGSKSPKSSKSSRTTNFKGSKSSKSSRTTNFKGSKGGIFSRTMTLTITNASFNQPFSGFFVMVHNSNAAPLYSIGSPASNQLALLAENGNPQPLVDLYGNAPGVGSAQVFNTNAPYVGGETVQIQLTVSEEFDLVTIATMAINTNDCFTAINGAELFRGQVLDLPGLDAGSEENNEMCNSIPGPGCASVSTDNVRSGNGENFVHVHRGFFGIGNLLPADRYDWRNPMMRVVVS